MKTNDILMILISIILCGVSIYILIRNKEKKSKKLIVYCIIGMFLVMIDACMLQFFYHDNAIYKNFRMIALLSIMASVAYVDFTELRIPNEYIITGLVYWVLSIFVELICGSQFIVCQYHFFAYCSGSPVYSFFALQDMYQGFNWRRGYKAVCGYGAIAWT